jgi:hypothetical protein
MSQQQWVKYLRERIEHYESLHETGLVEMFKAALRLAVLTVGDLNE